MDRKVLSLVLLCPVYDLHLGIFPGVLLDGLFHFLCLPTHSTPLGCGNRTIVVQVSWRSTLAVTSEVSPLPQLFPDTLPHAQDSVNSSLFSNHFLHKMFSCFTYCSKFNYVSRRAWFWGISFEPRGENNCL